VIRFDLIYMTEFIDEITYELYWPKKCVGALFGYSSRSVMQTGFHYFQIGNYRDLNKINRNMWPDDINRSQILQLLDLIDKKEPESVLNAVADTMIRPFKKLHIDKLKEKMCG